MPIVPISSFSLSIGTMRSVRCTGEIGKSDNHWIAGEVNPPGSNVLDVGDLSCPLHIAQTAFGVGTEQPGPRFDVLGRCVVERYSSEIFSVVQIQHAELGPADARRMGQNRLKNRLQIAR